MSWNQSTSTLSAVNIGLTNTNDRHAELRRYFKEEAREVTEHMKGVHHARKLPDMQTQYGETVEKMSTFVAQRPTYLQKTDLAGTGLKPPAHHGEGSQMKYDEFMNSMKASAHSEHDLNSRRLRYNKEMGRKASVDGIIVGESPMPKEYLFAQGQSHTAILAQTGSLHMPDSRIEPPYIPKGRKWVSDGVGYSNVPPSPRDPAYAEKLVSYNAIKDQRTMQASQGRPF